MIAQEITENSKSINNTNFTTGEAVEIKKKIPPPEFAEPGTMANNTFFILENVTQSNDYFNRNHCRTTRKSGYHSAGCGLVQTSGIPEAEIYVLHVDSGFSRWDYFCSLGAGSVCFCFISSQTFRIKGCLLSRLREASNALMASLYSFRLARVNPRKFSTRISLL
jgi:hypothetical protein